MNDAFKIGLAFYKADENFEGHGKLKCSKRSQFWGNKANDITFRTHLASQVDSGRLQLEHAHYFVSAFTFVSKNEFRSK